MGATTVSSFYGDKLHGLKWGRFCSVKKDLAVFEETKRP